jgi:outer membrane receptor protein involved in Fe transport
LLTNYNVDLLNTAVYTQFEYKSFYKLKIVAAARYDRLSYKFDNHLLPSAFTGAPDATDHFDHFTPKLGLTYEFSKGKGVYLNYSVGFAPPNITDLYTGVKVPVLKPSTYNNYETGGWVSFNKGYMEASIYKLDGKNEIVNVRHDDGTYQNQNAGKTSHKGVELNVKYAPVEDVLLRIGGTYAEHKYIDYVQQDKDYSGNKMPQAPPFIMNGEVTYKPHFCKVFRIAIEYQGMSEYYTDPQNTAKYKGFSVFNARAGYSLKQFELWANCINATGKIYATTVEKSAFGTSYRPGQLRTVNVGIAYNLNSK